MENSSDNNDFNTNDLENKIQKILRNHLIEINLKSNNNSNQKSNILYDYSVTSMKLIEGGFFNKKNEEENSHSIIISVHLISSEKIFKNFRNLSQQNWIKNRLLGKTETENYEELNFFFDVKYDTSKNSFDVEKINFNIDNEIKFYFPSVYDSLFKIHENENFGFYVAENKSNLCTGDLFISSKDKNIWKLSKKNVVISHKINQINNYDIEYSADFINVI